MRSIFLAALLAGSLSGCGDPDICGERPRQQRTELDLSSADAVALMRAQVPPSAKLLLLDSDPQGWLTPDGTSRSWFATFQDEDTQQAWFGRMSTLSGAATVSLEPKFYVDCPGPGATDLSSTMLVPDAVPRPSAVGGPCGFVTQSYSEAAPCAVANVANTAGAPLTGHSVFMRGEGQSFVSYYGDQGQFVALCGPCKTGPGDCVSCTR